MSRKFWLKSSGYPLVTKPFRTSKWMDWLRIVHAWLGIWGAVACLIFGVSTIALLHPELFPAGEPVTEISSLEVPASGIASNEELAAFVAGEMGFVSTAELGEPQRRGGGAARLQAAAAMGGGMGRARSSRPMYIATFSSIGREVRATFVEGNESIEVTETTQTLLRTINLMHLGRRARTGWTILGDIFSVAVVLLAITGFFLWNVFSGPRAAALSLFGIGLIFTLYFGLVGA